MIVNKPVSYSQESQKIVEEYEKDKVKHVSTYWNDEKLINIRKEIKEHYKSIQQLTCAYCNQKFNVKHSAVWDIEHIIPRKEAPQFMFTPENLCVACKDCNGTKSDNVVLKNPCPQKQYPQKSENYLIIHPHFDEYEKNIAIYLNKVYSPKTPKGQKTIEMCGLLRYSYQVVGWDEAIANNPNILIIAEKLLKEEDTEKMKSLEMELLMITQVGISNTLLSWKIQESS